LRRASRFGAGFDGASSRDSNETNVDSFIGGK
jgi:hypothetical protein